MKKILIPTDFSESAKNAINYAINIFSSDKVKFILLNSYTEPISSREILVTISDILHHDSEVRVMGQKQYFRNHYPERDLDIEGRSEYGTFQSVIEEIVDSENIDFVVMGTQGASGLRKIITGSNTSRIVKKAKCPVLVIPETVQYQKVNQITFAADYFSSDNGYISSLTPLKELAEEYDSHLMILNVIEEDEVMKENRRSEGMKIHKSLEHIPHNFYFIENNDITEGISEFVHLHKTDMLVVVKRKRSWFKDLFHASSSGELSMLSDIPLLVLSENLQF